MTEQGAELALSQLRALVEVADGAVALLKDEVNRFGEREFTVSIDTSGLAHAATGIAVRDRERFTIVVSPAFPFEPPAVFSAHRRWAGTPHVQWGSHLCLYAVPAVEWSPQDGIRGLIARLSEWVERAAAGTLDPDDQPLHPPAVYPRERGAVVVRPDLGDRVPWLGDGTEGSFASLVAWCALVGRQRVDVLEWIDASTARSRAESAAVFDRGRPVVAVPVVLTQTDFGFEFPLTVKEISKGLTESGYSRNNLLADLTASVVVNRRLRVRQQAEDPVAAGSPWDGSGGESTPLLTAMIVGTPSRRVEGDIRLAHLAAWRVDTFSDEILGMLADGRTFDFRGLRKLVLRQFETAAAGWIQVMEARPEVTRRRDQATPSSWLVGKRILVLGCGALGSPVAEFCVRTGAAALTVVDHGAVTPGILVRQPFSDRDIGQPKAEVLAERLGGIGDASITPSTRSILPTFFAEVGGFGAFDLVVDATANAAVRSIVEKARIDVIEPPPLITMVINHTADRGLVTTNLGTATGAGADTFRKVARLASTGSREWADIANDLFPITPHTQMFFPEPGCSAPTFVGAAAQTSALAGMMLHEALTVLARPHEREAAVGPVTFASAVRLGSSSHGTSRAMWTSDTVKTDVSGRYQARISAEALAEIRAEVRRGARVRHPDVETGGMLLGAFDDAVGVVYVDRASGPPPDSYLGETYFQHGTEGTQERVDVEAKRSNNMIGFVGFWHTHPGGVAQPSATDEQGMASIVGPDGSRRRALMMILGANTSRWRAWRDHGGDLPGIYMRVVPRGMETTFTTRRVGGADASDLQQLPAGTYFRGGYSGDTRIDQDHSPIPAPAKTQFRWLWQRRWPWRWRRP